MQDLVEFLSVKTVSYLLKLLIFLSHVYFSYPCAKNLLLYVFSLPEMCINAPRIKVALPKLAKYGRSQSLQLQLDVFQ